MAFTYSSFQASVFSVQNMFLYFCPWASMLWHVPAQWFFGFSNIYISAFLTDSSPDCHSGLCGVPSREGTSLRLGVSSFKVYWNVTLVKNPSHSFKPGTTIAFMSVALFILIHITLVPFVTRSTFYKRPPGVTAGFECFLYWHVSCLEYYQLCGVVFW